MYTFLMVLIVFACVLLILVVLVQDSKGGGFASGFSSTTQMMGVKKSSDILEKATWVLVGVVAGFTLLSSFAIDREKTTSNDPQTQISLPANFGTGTMPTITEVDGEGVETVVPPVGQDEK